MMGNKNEKTWTELTPLMSKQVIDLFSIFIFCSKSEKQCWMQRKLFFQNASFPPYKNWNTWKLGQNWSKQVLSFRGKSKLKSKSNKHLSRYKSKMETPKGRALILFGWFWWPNWIAIKEVASRNGWQRESKLLEECDVTTQFLAGPWLALIPR